jgi:small subunit ribosomal protein S18
MNNASNTGSTSGSARRTKKKVCRFCSDHQIYLDYKEPKLLVSFVTERGKIIPRRVTGNCAYHQRRVQEAVKRARLLALLPFMASYQP